MADHTPGPWFAQPYQCHAATSIVAKGVHIAECGGLGSDSDDCLADARLIAAAPRMAAVIIRAAHLLAELPKVDQTPQMLALRSELIATIRQASPAHYGESTP